MSCRVWCGTGVISLSYESSDGIEVGTISTGGYRDLSDSKYFSFYVNGLASGYAYYGIQAYRRDSGEYVNLTSFPSNLAPYGNLTVYGIASGGGGGGDSGEADDGDYGWTYDPTPGSGGAEWIIYYVDGTAKWQRWGYNVKLKPFPVISGKTPVRSTWRLNHYGGDNSNTYQEPGTWINIASTDDIKAYIEYKDITYYYAYLKYNANGGSGAPSQQSYSSTTSGTSITFTISSTIPSRSGYTFLGWSKSSTATSSSYSPGGTISVNTGSTVTLYAVWKQNVYYAYLNYNANGGSGSFTTGSNTSTSNNVSVPIQVTNETPNARSGYTFLGWASNSTATTASYHGGDTYYVKTGSTSTLYAVWQRITYTITVDANGGEFLPGSETTQSAQVASGNSFSFSSYSNNVSRYGYALKGWGASSTTTTISYSTTGSYTPTVSRTWYAIWEATTKTLTYHGNGGIFYNLGGSVDTRSDTTTGTSITVASGDAYGLAREGYSFVEWNTSSAGSGSSYAYGSSYPFGSSTSGNLYAIWERITYTITLNSNGGSSNRTIIVNYGDLFEFTEAREPPARTGYTFKGWASSSTATIDDIEYVTGGSYRVYATKTWFAVWKFNEYDVTLTYDANGGYLTAYGSTTSHAFSYTGTDAGTQVEVKSASDLGAVRTGYDFSTWNIAADGTGATYNPGETIGMYANNRTLYAIWNICTYTVTVNPNGGSYSNGSYSSQSVSIDYNNSYNFGTWVPSRTGYDLLGWSADANATSATYAWNDSYNVKSSDTWYAVWKVHTWRLTLDTNGGTFPEGSPYNGSTTYSIKRNYNSRTSLSVYSDIVSKEDDTVLGYASYKYEIAGWDTNKNKSWVAGATYQPSSTITMPDEDLTLYAVWERINCIRYISNGRLFGEIDTVEYMDNYTIRTTEPTWGDHVFKGWSVNGYTSPDDVAYHPGDVISNVSGYITLTACWGWEPMDEFYWHGSAGADSAVFVSGQPVEDALLASGWNNFYTSLNTYLYRSSGSQLPSPSYTQSGVEITASIFNAARGDLISSGAASYPSQVASGDTIYPDYFVGTRGGRFSLRNSLNALIALFNASLEDE